MLKPGARVLVTGASGFLGRHLLPQLLANGASVTALVRSARSAKSLPAGVNAAMGDCGDRGQIERAIAGHDIVIHMAALLFGGTWRDYLDVNSAFARNIAQAAKKEPSLKRVVLVSSLAAAGPSGHAPGRSESERPEPVSAYGWSKLMAEEILAGALCEKLVILRPPIIYGSGDKGLLPLFKSCARGFGVSAGMRKFPVSIIHANDAAKAIILACSPKASGVYHLSDGAAHDMDGICQAMGRALGREKVTVLRPPLPLMGASAAISSSVYGMLKAFGASGIRPPAWNRDKYLEARQPGWLANSGRIRSELGFAPAYDLEAGMEEAASGYKKDGWL